MSQVFVTTYKVVPPFQKIAEEHFAGVARVQASHAAVMKEFGAVAYRQDYARRLHSLYFPADQLPPPGFRQTNDKRDQNGTIIQEAVPTRSTKIGKELYRRFGDTERVPADFLLAEKFGWKHEAQYDGHRRFFPTVQELILPKVRYFIRLPRTLDDGWTGHLGLMAIPEDAYMWELENHNRLARASKEAA